MIFVTTVQAQPLPQIIYPEPAGSTSQLIRTRPIAAPVIGGRVILPGLGTAPRRTPVNSAELPWSAVAKINMTGVGSCTGVLIGPTTMLTAAHCMVDHRVGRFVSPGQVHILLGYDRGQFTTHATVARYHVPPSYDPTQVFGTSFSDVAVLRFDQPISASVVPLAEGDAGPGRALMLGGYGQDRPEVILADANCIVQSLIPDRRGNLVLAHTCAATRGTSGGPVFARSGDGTWRLMGLNVTARTEGQGGGAVPASSIRAFLAE